MRSLATIGMIVLLAAAVPARALAGPSLVIDVRSGAVLHEEDALAPWFPASLTKLMTAYLAFRALRDGRLTLEQKITCSPLAHSQPPSKLGLPIGGTISVDLALKLLVVKSANDVAVMLAEAISGSVEKFADEMNLAAAALGMSGTHFVNPNGLPAVEQVTTARDLAVLSRAILRDFPEHLDLFSLDKVKIGKRYLRTHNYLLGRFEGATGMKTGYICASGYNLVASAKRGDRSLIAVVLGGTSGKDRNDRAAELLEKGFADAWLKTLIPGKTVAGMSGPSQYGARPEHMGPVVCKGRYRGAKDAYAVDERIYAQAREKQLAAVEAAESAGDEANPLTENALEAEEIPLPPRRPDL